MFVLSEKEKELATENIRLVYFVLKKMNIFADNFNFEDYVGAGYTGLCRAAHFYKPNTISFTTYAFNVIKREILREIYYLKKDVKAEFSFDELAFAIEDGENEISSVETKMYLQNLIKDSKSYLGETEYKVMCQYCEGKSSAETAEILKISLSAVSRAKNRAVSQIKQRIQNCEV